MKDKIKNIKKSVEKEQKQNGENELGSIYLRRRREQNQTQKMFVWMYL